MKIYTARVCLDANFYKSLHFYRRLIHLARVNRYAVACGICKQVYPAGALVWQKMYANTFYICLACLKRIVLKLADRGFNVAPHSALAAALYVPGQYSAKQVLAALRVFYLRRDARGNRRMIPHTPKP